jgi:hypothetical protein
MERQRHKLKARINLSAVSMASGCRRIRIPVRINWIKEEKGQFFTLLELLLALAIIWFLASKVLTVYFKKPIADKQSSKFISEQGIDTTSSKTILATTKHRLQVIDQQLKAQEKEMENIK